jgi:hypothetical protein
MTVTKEQYQHALDVLHEVLPHQLQVKDQVTGEWKNEGPCHRGQEAAYGAMNEYRDNHPDAVLRVLAKNEADKYREGILTGKSMAKEQLFPKAAKKEKKRDNGYSQFIRGMFMPENL